MAEVEPSRGRRQTVLAVGAGVAVAVVVLVGLIVFTRDREPANDARVPDAPTTTLAPASTASSVAPVVDSSTALYPDTTMSERFFEPTDVARSFAVRYLGMTDPAVGEFMEGEPRAGEVGVRAKPGRGPVTTVVVRQLGGEERAPWFVTAAFSENLHLDTPDPLDPIASPVKLTGQSRSFEAHVNVGIREDGQLGKTFLGEGFYTGGSSGPELGPFEHSQEFRPPTRPWGAVLLFVYSAEDGSLSEATVVRVRFQQS